MIALSLAIVTELIGLIILRYRPMRERWRGRLVAAWFWSGYAVFVWAFLIRFGERGSLYWREGDAPWAVGLAVGALLLAYGMRWVQERHPDPPDSTDWLQSALNDPRRTQSPTRAS